MMETQKLMCAPGVFESLDHGKEVTIRKGIRDIQLGKLIFENTDTHEQAYVWIDYVIYCILELVPEEMYVLNGFKDYDDMLIQMKEFYPDITGKTEVTVVVFYR